MMDRRIRCLGFGLFGFLALLIILAWLIGRILTDRYAWSQWLFWIPTPTLLPVVALGLLTAWLRPAGKPPSRRRRIARWVACGCALLVYFSIFEHRLLHRTPPLPPPDRTLRLVHWNAEPVGASQYDTSIEAIIALDGDITILSNPGGIHLEVRAKAWMGDSMQLVTAWPFALFSRVPIQSVRPLISTEEIFVVAAELDATEKLGRPIVLYMIDLPSNPRIGRAALARRVRAMLDRLNAPPPDIVAGDFNIARGSTSLKIMFPNLREAFDDSSGGGAGGGHGYGASFNRAWPLPLYHIDHVLFGNDLHAPRYDLVDPKVSRHMAQVAWVSAR